MFGGGNSIGGGRSSCIGKSTPTDLHNMVCCFIFLAFWGFSIVAAVYGVSNGNLENIAQPYDDVGNPRGVPSPNPRVQLPLRDLSQQSRSDQETQPVREAVSEERFREDRVLHQLQRDRLLKGDVLDHSCRRVLHTGRERIHERLQ